MAILSLPFFSSFVNVQVQDGDIGLRFAIGSRNVFLETAICKTAHYKLHVYCQTFFDEQINQAEQELQGRHDVEEHWPQSEEVMQRGQQGLVDEQHQYQRLDPRYRPVRCAPFAAANLSINSRPFSAELRCLEAKELRQLYPYVVTDNLIYEMRLLRTFDPEWFDTVYAIALTLELSRLPLEVTE